MYAFSKKREKVENLFNEYRKAGLTLMATVITLSSGGFFSLFNNEKTKAYSFLFLIPIFVALLQMLSHYLASQKKAIAEYFQLKSRLAKDGDQGWDADVEKQQSFEKARLLYKVSDNYCWLSCVSLVAVTIYPMTLFSNTSVLIAIFILLGGCLVYWLRSWYYLKRSLAMTDWSNPDTIEPSS